MTTVRRVFLRRSHSPEFIKHEGIGIFAGALLAIDDWSWRGQLDHKCDDELEWQEDDPHDERDNELTGSF